MRQLTELTSDHKQRFTVSLDNNEAFELTLEYIEQQQHWLYSITYQGFSFQNMRLVYGLNILRRFKNIIPFGLGVTSEDLGDPQFLDDFTNGRIEIDVLNKEEVETIENEFYKKK